MAPNAILYAEKGFVNNHKMVTANNREIALKEKLTPITVVDLWASWCGNCIEAFPYLDKLEEHYANEKKVSFLRISLDDKGDNWKRSVERLRFERDDTYWISGGMKSDFARKFDVNFLPRYIVLNQEGKILNLFAPHIGETQKFISLIDSYLK
ncbi:TlpA family protein disulfide reductase [Runella aurantiaca]|uniref:TlpA family protein disulfide reductase n=1 Tax=Runella aurantiaca TaxID=2282308 RepID=A0A369IA39_9BACT|nr:TlpA disulfide reductase family protein [Runella aurantiaca]RDB06508.1 TlpA family protein disulfide reductase [Runella aurantiaca]